MINWLKILLSFDCPSKRVFLGVKYNAILIYFSIGITVRPWHSRRKNLCSSKFVQLLLLNRGRAVSLKKRAALRFSLHKFVYLKLFWTQLTPVIVPQFNYFTWYSWTRNYRGQLKTVHLQGPCSLRPCSWRPHCTT